MQYCFGTFVLCRHDKRFQSNIDALSLVIRSDLNVVLYQYIDSTQFDSEHVWAFLGVMMTICVEYLKVKKKLKNEKW